MASPPSSPSPTKPSAAVAVTAASSPNPLAKPPPATWSHQETVHLIHVYQDKWYSNNRAHLKTPQWEEVAATVAARCGGSGKLPPKTATQCRHKMEKLRKRFRAERQRGGGGGPTGWLYYEHMDRLEHGPKASARPISVVPYRAKSQNFNGKSHGFQNDYDEYEEEEDEYDHEDDENDEDEEQGPYSRSQSINYILRRPSVVNRFPSDRSFSGSAVPDLAPRHLATKRMREDFMDVGVNDQEEAQEESERIRKAAISKLAREIRAFAETYVGMENVKMEMMKEAERSRLEMENKRMEMILDSQKKMVEAIAKALAGPQNGTMKMDPEPESRERVNETGDDL